jgi:cholesterol transport system auxiliary component
MRLVALLVIALVAGCSSGFRSSAPPVQAYVLHAASVAAPAAASAAAPAPAAAGTLVSLRIARPASAPGLDSDHIAILERDRRFGVYAGSRWAAPLPEVVESLAVQTFRDSGRFRTVEGSRGSFPADYLLQITIRRFEADYSEQSDTPVIRVTLDCILGRQASRELVATFVAESSQSAAANRLSSVVGGFEQAADTALAAAAERAASAIRTSTSRGAP